MKTNLLLLDSLRNMENLIYSGFSLSNELKRKLKIVYIWDFNLMRNGEYVAMPAAPNIDANVRVAEKQISQDYEKAEDEIKRITASYLAKFSQSVSFEIEVTDENRSEYIKNLVEEEKEVLLMMSNYNSYSKASGGMINYPDVISNVSCPLLIVPDDLPFISFNHILYATAFLREDEAALESLGELFNAGGGKNVTIFHNSESDDFEDQLKWLGFQALSGTILNGFHLNYVLSREKNVRTAIESLIAGEKIDLIVLLREKKGFFEDLFSRSETDYAITHINKPILVYQEEYLNYENLKEKYA